MEAQAQGEDFAVGCILSIKTTLGEEFQAQLGKLQEGVKSAAGPKRNIRLLKANYIKEFTFLGQGEDPLDVKKCFLDLNTLQSREESAIRQAEADAERIGVGVSAEAQRIFDALSKTLPVRWDKTTIVVMNEVRVGSPYLPESVSGGTPAANERVRAKKWYANAVILHLNTEIAEEHQIMGKDGLWIVAKPSWTIDY
ncbi:hypothetical protein DH2020_027009 [Rehmannia glutinosa]|uniref:AD domain-containing protein n=1 Tax=Rehmannia glutinosa TaxID=99300 RepID=A0ABR0VX48_REHGL